MTAADRLRGRIREETALARVRVRSSLWSATQAALASALSWYVAHDLIGHRQPFFAPIAALIAVGTSNVQRSYRSVQMVGGVLLGIGVGEAFSSLLGVGAVTIGVVALVTLAAALFLSVGPFGQGMMFVNQAGASAVLVVALHHTGTGNERLVDALVGGAVAILVGVVLFPVEPVGLIRRAEGNVLRSLARAITDLARLLGDEREPSPDWLLAKSRSVIQALVQLAQARRDARTATRIAPRRWSSRDAVLREAARSHAVDLLANTSLTLLRVATDASAHGETLHPEIRTGIELFAHLLSRLAEAPQPPSRDVSVPLAEEVAAAIAAIEPHSTPHAPLIASLTREAERDLLLLVQATDP